MIRAEWTEVAPSGKFCNQTFFQSEGYARLLALDNRRPLWLAALDSSGRVVARWLLFETPSDYLHPPRGVVGRLLDVHLAANHSPSLAENAEPTQSDAIRNALLAKVARRVARARPVSATLRLDPRIDVAELAAWRAVAARHGFETAPSWSYLSELPPTVEAMFTRIKSDRRTKVRKGESDGITFEVGRDVAAFEEYYAVRCDNARRNGVGIVPWGHFKAACDALGTDGANRVFLARMAGRVAAGQLALIDRGFVTLNGVSVASWAFESKIPANDVLQWRVIAWAIENGMRWIDYVGADPTTTDPKIKAIDHFKSRWGTTLCESMVLHCAGSRLRRVGSRVARRGGL